MRAFTAAAMMMVLASAAQAAPRPDPSCWFDPNPAIAGAPVTLNAVDLPTDTPVTITFNLYPIGGGSVYPDGTFTATFPMPAEPITAYFWTRGHGKSLLQPGPGLNDYHVIAYCTVTLATAREEP